MTAMKQGEKLFQCKCHVPKFHNSTICIPFYHDKFKSLQLKSLEFKASPPIIDSLSSLINLKRRPALDQPTAKFAACGKSGGNYGKEGPFKKKFTKNSKRMSHFNSIKIYVHTHAHPKVNLLVEA